MSALGSGKIKQVAYITEDLDASIRHWIAFAGIGPWTVYKNVVMSGHYHGVPTTIKMDVGLSYRDDVQIELIMPTSPAASPYRDELGRPRVGMHHIAWFSARLADDVKDATRRGLTCIFEASNGAASVAYCASASEPGLLYELIESTPAVLDGFEAGLTASRAWDGKSEPVTIIDFGA